MKRTLAARAAFVLAVGIAVPAAAQPPAGGKAPPQWLDLLSEKEFKALHELSGRDEPPPRGETIVLTTGSKAYLSLPEGARPGHAVPGHAVPGHAVPGHAVPGHAVPGHAVPGHAVPGHAVPGHPVPGIVVIHEWWGLNDHIRRWSDRLAAAGYAALAVDLYGGAVATTPDQAMRLMRSVKEDKALAELRAAHRLLQTHPSIRAPRTACIGWCFGGGWSLRMALDQPDLDAAVVYYGRLVTDPRVLGRIRASVIGVFGNRDQGIPPAVVDAFEAGLEKAGVAHEIHRYDANHAFANPSSARYDEGSASDAWDRVQAFLRARLAGGGGGEGEPRRPEESILPRLSRAERAAGWRMLFDGTSPEAWRGYRKDSFPPKGWVVQDGALHVVAGGGGGDIVTREEFGDFDLTLDWRVAPKANSGIMYRVTERHDAPWQSGPEYQILDDAGLGTPPTSKHSAGALYDLYAPPEGKEIRPPGPYNHARILVRRGRVRHWLNGVKTVDCRLGSDDWKARVAASKFQRYEGFGKAPRGAIDLQDHGGDVWFRNLRIRDLDAPMPGEERLLGGTALEGWTSFPPRGGGGGGDRPSPWTVEEGVLTCAGSPKGYLRTEGAHTSFVLALEWRFEPDAPQGSANSGVLLRVAGEDRIWPSCLEAQLRLGSTGDLWALGGFDLAAGDPARLDGRRVRRSHDAENPPGEWNEMEIVADGGTVILSVNGEEVNRVTGVPERPGAIALQSEGAVVHFRKVRIAPIR